MAKMKGKNGKGCAPSGKSSKKTGTMADVKFPKGGKSGKRSGY